MSRFRKVLACVLVLSMLMICACQKTSDHRSGIKKNPEASKPENRGSIQTQPTDPTDYPTPTVEPDDGIVDMTMFVTLALREKDPDNDIEELIAQKTGIRVNEAGLNGMYSDEAISAIIASGDLPEFIYSDSGMMDLYQGGYLIAWDDYLEEFPNIKELYTDKEWDRFRMNDGHIYWIDIFDRFRQKDTTTTHIGQAFWIQVRVLEWAGYPEIKTLDEYFDLIESYAEANPELPDGTPVVPYTCLCDSWRYYSIENAPMYLAGFPNDGCVIVSIDEGIENPKVIDYNTTGIAKEYFRKLNEEYEKGMIDPDFAAQTYDEYIYKLSTGCVLGMCDQYWDFAYTISSPFSVLNYGNDGSVYTLSEIGCDYVPLGISYDGSGQQWHTYGSDLSTTSGFAVTTGCYDPYLAFSYLDTLLEQEIHDLRFWGIEGVDYLVDAQGLFYRTEEMRFNWASDAYKAKHTCEYSYMPQWRGISRDGKNCMKPADQPSEFKEGLSKPLVKCFEAYGVDNYVEMIGSENVERTPWYPLWTWSNNLSTATPGGIAWNKMAECKHKWLPMLVLSNDFEETWEEYMEAYEECDPQVFLDEAQAEVDARVEAWRNT